jgi:nicotinamide-nucleotide amidase
MKAHLITVGDELLIGQTLNSNAAYIGEKLYENQIKLNKVTVIGDDESTMMKSFQEGMENADLVIVTGGLGPTHDDITKKCIVNYFNSELQLNEQVLADVTERFKQRGREVTPSNRDQALVPKIASIIRNSKGTAPGMWIEKDDKIFTAIPGVPYEMREMIDSFIIPNLKEKFRNIDSFSVTTNLLSTGIPESILYERLGNMDELLEGGSLAFLPNQFGVKMRLTLSGETEEEANDKLIQVEQKIRGIAGRNIYGKNYDSLEQVIGRLMDDRGLTISVAESCTGGLISSRLTNVAGSSKYFERGFITYSNGAKVEHLSIDEDMIHQYGAVSLEVARLMADGVRKVSGTDIGLAVTGIMGPTGAAPDKPVGLVFIGICDEKICTAREYRFGDDRLLNKDRTSQAALEMVRRHLLGIPYDE